MRLRRRDVPLTTDSFLDIVSNVVGVMVLVAVVVLVNVGRGGIALGTPVLRDAPKDADRVLYECRADGVLRVDEDQVSRAINRALDDEVQRKGEKLDVDDVPALFARQDVGDVAWRVTAELTSALQPTGQGLSLVRRPSWVYTRRPGVSGETSDRLARATSAFRRGLASADPRKAFLFFIVRDDGFEVFRSARRIALERGFAVGWHPWPRDRALKFTSNGGLGRKVQ
jgi:hypothetical protein